MSASPDAPRSLRRAFVHGTAWVFAGRWAVRALGFVSTALLARLLAPADFGVIALAMLVVAFVEVFGLLGRRVRARAPSRADARTLGHRVDAAPPAEPRHRGGHGGGGPLGGRLLPRGAHRAGDLVAGGRHRGGGLRQHRRAGVQPRAALRPRVPAAGDGQGAAARGDHRRGAVAAELLGARHRHRVGLRVRRRAELRHASVPAALVARPRPRAPRLLGADGRAFGGLLRRVAHRRDPARPARHQPRARPVQPRLRARPAAGQRDRRAPQPLADAGPRAPAARPQRHGLGLSAGDRRAGAGLGAGRGGHRAGRRTDGARRAGGTVAGRHTAAAVARPLRHLPRALPVPDACADRLRTSGRVGELRVDGCRAARSGRRLPDHRARRARHGPGARGRRRRRAAHRHGHHRAARRRKRTRSARAPRPPGRGQRRDGRGTLGACPTAPGRTPSSSWPARWCSARWCTPRCAALLWHVAGRPDGGERMALDALRGLVQRVRPRRPADGPAA